MTPTLIQDHPYNPDAIFDPNGPLDPTVMDEAVCAIMRNTQVDLSDTPSAASRRMYAAMRALAAFHPRNEPELMLGVQALSAYHAANAAWRRGAASQPRDDVRRHIATAASAARAYDSMLRALERRQAKPLSVPIGRPPPRDWPPVDPDSLQNEWKRRCGVVAQDLAPDPARQSTMSDDELVTARGAKGQHWLLNPNEGLDIANTDGILPDGSMIVPWNPTAPQEAYMERRLAIMYLREQAENHRNGTPKEIKFRAIRAGDLIP